jgi:hypothetical protein
MLQEFVGRWRIVEMEQWDKDFIDMIVPGFFEFRKDGTGEFQFGCVNGQMDCRAEKCDSQTRLSFSWEGNDECDPASGRGWAEIEGNTLSGHIYVHGGDDSSFKAQRQKPRSSSRSKKR